MCEQSGLSFRGFAPRDADVSGWHQRVGLTFDHTDHTGSDTPNGSLQTASHQLLCRSERLSPLWWIIMMKIAI